MKAYIQHCHTSGLGDMYTDVYCYINLAKFLRDIGYEVHLLYVPPERVKHIKDFYLMMFDEIILSYFDSYSQLDRPILSKEYNGTTVFDEWCVHDPIYCKDNRYPGQHHWDLFVDNFSFINNIQSYIEKNNLFYKKNDLFFNVFRYDSNKICNNTITNTPLIKPLLNSKIVNNSKTYLENIKNPFLFFHLRFRREEQELMKDSNILNQIAMTIDSYSSDYKIMLGSSSRFIANSFKNYKNTFIYHDSDNSNLKIDFLSELSEMVCIEKSEKIIAYNELSWVSNFLFYALLHNKFLKLYSLDHNFR